MRLAINQHAPKSQINQKSKCNTAQWFRSYSCGWTHSREKIWENLPVSDTPRNLMNKRLAIKPFKYAALHAYILIITMQMRQMSANGNPHEWRKVWVREEKTKPRNHLVCSVWNEHSPPFLNYLISLYAQSGLKETVSLYQETEFNLNPMEGADKNVMCHRDYTSPYLYLPTDLFSVGNKRHLIDT